MITGSESNIVQADALKMLGRTHMTAMKENNERPHASPYETGAKDTVHVINKNTGDAKG